METKLSVLMISTVRWFRSTEEKLKLNHAEIMKKNFNKPLRMTNDDEENFKEADKCRICYRKYVEKDIRARDHCHITENIKDRLIKIVIFHTLRGYDSHFIAQEIGKIATKLTYKNNKGEEKQMDMYVPPNNMEKYMAFVLGKVSPVP